jgi:inner membrane protein
MDPLTHALTGAVLRNLGFRRKAALWVLLFSAVAPDLDYLGRLWGMGAFLSIHRGATHGVFALFLVPLALGLAFGRRKDFWYFFFISLVGYGSHIALDLTNQYGVRLLWPLDRQWRSADLLFIVDPYIMAGLALSVVLAVILKRRAWLVSALTIALLLSYIGLRYHYHEKTEELLRANLDDYVIQRVSPMPADPFRWGFVARNGNGIKVGLADLFMDRIYVNMTLPVQPPDPAIEGSISLDIVRSFLSFSRLPYATVERTPGRVTVRWRELSYAYLPGERFAATVVTDGQGRVLSKGFRF